MFEHLKAVPPDPILGILSAYAADPNPKKIDLGIGVYKDEAGATPMLECVVEAEKILIATQTSKSYLGPPGVVGFNNAMSDLLFGPGSDVLQQGRVRTIQTPGGTGGLRVAADLVKTAVPDAAIWASDPTWPNHMAIFPASGLPMHAYPYFDRLNSTLRFVDMMESLRQRGPGDVVLFHACCHNPCGVSPDPEQWEAITNLAAERGFTPMVDIAYMGFERGIEEDTLAVRLFSEKCPEVIVVSSCSKNFAVYRERTGAISIVCENDQKAADVQTVINSLTRKNYSMPPTHGPAVIDIILHSDELTKLWESEVTTMRNRINSLRKILSEKIIASGISKDFSFLQRQSGMFSFLGLSVEQVHRLKNEFAIYTVDSARINVASFNDGNIEYFIDALSKVLED
jgi:aspartate aminotransferase